jgi:hypothetical protein
MFSKVCGNSLKPNLAKIKMTRVKGRAVGGADVTPIISTGFFKEWMPWENVCYRSQFDSKHKGGQK